MIVMIVLEHLKFHGDFDHTKVEVLRMAKSDIHEVQNLFMQLKGITLRSTMPRKIASRNFSKSSTTK
jgi:hypothetical protein